ncbi:MAG: DEAD/DEAH box helicase [Verrucomicrobiota bacterium]
MPHEVDSQPQRFHALQLADPAARRFLPPEKFEQVQRRAGEIQARVTPPIPPGIQAELRPYQLEGYHFLAYLAENRFGGILADDMGLGKNIQTLAWLVWLRARAEPPGPSLVVCPKSVTDNWRAESARFAPGLRVRVWQSTDIRSLPALVADSDLHVINYAQLRTLGEELRRTDFLAVILDEGQYIKNPSSVTTVLARQLRAAHRLILSGTPIENRLLDLWSLMSFAMPGVLGSRTEFLRLYDRKDDAHARRRLAARVRPFLLRRTKNQVARDLPDRVEEDLYCEIEGEQQKLYRAELKRAQQMLLKVSTGSEFNEQRFHVLTSLLRLRQICCDPRLLDEKSQAPSAKVEALLETIEPLCSEGQKVLVFSQFVGMLELLRAAL